MRWSIIYASEDLTVGNFCLLVNSAGSLIEGEYKIEYLGVEIDFSGTFACEECEDYNYKGYRTHS